MVNMPDGGVILAGLVFAARPWTDFETKASKGIELMVNAHEGCAIVRVSNDAIARLNREGFTTPTQGSTIAAYARPNSWAKGEGAGNITYTYVRPATVFDAEGLAASIEASKPSAKAAAA
jgi:hypothetical protein